MSTDIAPRRKPRTLALELVDSLGDRIRDGRLALGDKLPTEAAIMAEFNVSRTVVREAISKLQASGLVETRHGIGTFVLGLGQAPGFKITPDQFSTLRDVIVDAVAVKVEAREVLAKRLGQAIQAIGARRVAQAHHFVLAVKAGHMVGAGKHHALDALLANGLIEVVRPHDVGLQDGVPGLLGGHAPQVHHGVHPFEQRQHGTGVFQPRGAQFFARRLAAQVGDVGQAQGGAVRLQARAQFTPQSASGPGQ